MDINQLIHFQAAARYENLTRAATELYITQSALSKSIRQLENELHTELFDRHGKTILLNSSGQVVLKYANHIIEMTNLMNGELNQGVHANEIVLNIATNRPLIAHNILPKISVQHSELQLNSKLIAMESDIAAHFLLSEIYDLLITSFPVNHPDIISVLHSEETVCLCVTEDSPLASRTIIRKEDFNGLTLPATQFSYDVMLKPLVNDLKHSSVSFNTIMVPDIAAVNYLMKISSIPAVFTDVAWSFNQLPNRRLIEIEGVPKRENYINYLSRKASRVSPLANLLMTDYRLFSEDH